MCFNPKFRSALLVALALPLLAWDCTWGPLANTPTGATNPTPEVTIVVNPDEVQLPDPDQQALENQIAEIKKSQQELKQQLADKDVTDETKRKALIDQIHGLEDTIAKLQKALDDLNVAKTVTQGAQAVSPVSDTLRTGTPLTASNTVTVTDHTPTGPNVPRDRFNMDSAGTPCNGVCTQVGAPAPVPGTIGVRIGNYVFFGLDPITGKPYQIVWILPSNGGGNNGGGTNNPATPLPTHTPGPSPTAIDVTATAVNTSTNTPSATITPSATLTRTPSPTLSATPTATLPNTPGPNTPTWTPSPVPSDTPTATHTWTPSATPTATLTATPTLTLTPTNTVTPSPTASLTATPTETSTVVVPPSVTPTPSSTPVGPSPTNTPTSRVSPSDTPVVPPTNTPCADRPDPYPGPGTSTATPASCVDTPTPTRTSTPMPPTQVPSDTPSATSTPPPECKDDPGSVPCVCWCEQHTNDPVCKNNPTPTRTNTPEVPTPSPTQCVDVETVLFEQWPPVGGLPAGRDHNDKGIIEVTVPESDLTTGWVAIAAGSALMENGYPPLYSVEECQLLILEAGFHHIVGREFMVRLFKIHLNCPVDNFWCSPFCTWQDYALKQWREERDTQKAVHGCPDSHYVTPYQHAGTGTPPFLPSMRVIDGVECQRVAFGATWHNLLAGESFVGEIVVYSNGETHKKCGSSSAPMAGRVFNGVLCPYETELDPTMGGDPPCNASNLVTPTPVAIMRIPARTKAVMRIPARTKAKAPTAVPATDVPQQAPQQPPRYNVVTPIPTDVPPATDVLPPMVDPDYEWHTGPIQPGWIILAREVELTGTDGRIWNEGDRQRDGCWITGFPGYGEFRRIDSPQGERCSPWPE